MKPPPAWLDDERLVARAICQDRGGCPCAAGSGPCLADALHGQAARAAIAALRANHRLIRPPTAKRNPP